jgi:hypothetical protein
MQEHVPEFMRERVPHPIRRRINIHEERYRSNRAESSACVSPRASRASVIIIKRHHHMMIEGAWCRHSKVSRVSLPRHVNPDSFARLSYLYGYNSSAPFCSLLSNRAGDLSALELSAGCIQRITRREPDRRHR